MVAVLQEQQQGEPLLRSTEAAPRRQFRLEVTRKKTLPETLELGEVHCEEQVETHEGGI